MVKRRGVKSVKKQTKRNSPAKRASAASTTKDVLPYGVTRTGPVEEPEVTEGEVEPHFNEAGNIVIDGVEYENGGEVTPVAKETKPKVTKAKTTKARKRNSVKKTTKTVAKSKKTEPKVVAKAKPVPNGTFIPPNELYDEEDYATFVQLAEGYISAQNDLSIYMQEHDDRAYKMLNKVSSNFIRSLIDRRAGPEA